MSVKRYWCSSAVELRADGGGTLSANFHANSHFVRASDYDALEAELTDFKEGSRVTFPQNKEHAQAMSLVATMWLREHA